MDPIFIKSVIAMFLANYFIFEDYPMNYCTLENGSYGRCVRIDECPEALELLKIGIARNVCGYQNGYPIVCCNKNPVLGSAESQSSRPYYENVGEFSLKTPCSLKAFPQKALLGFDNNGETVWGCEGRLVTASFVLAEPHCMASSEFGPVKYVRVGNFYEDLIVQQDFTVLNVYKLPTNFEFASLELNREADMTEYIKAACLKDDEDYENVPVFPITFFHLMYLRQNIVYRPMSEATFRKAVLNTYRVCVRDSEEDTCEDPDNPVEPSTTGISEIKTFIVFVRSFFWKLSPTLYVHTLDYFNYMEENPEETLPTVEALLEQLFIVHLQ